MRALSPLLAVAAVLAVAPAAQAASSADGLAISPAPGTLTAAPETQISIYGIPKARIVSVKAVGSQSGAHSGTLKGYSRNDGASFVPAKPFTPGERVRATLQVKGRKASSWTFEVARHVADPPILNLRNEQKDKQQSFLSEPGLRPPRITVRKAGAESSGSLFLTPLPSPTVHPGNAASITISPIGPGGPMIVDAKGKLVWFKQLDMPVVAANLRIQRYRGKPVLTWWEGPVTFAAYGLGKAFIADSSYRTIKTIEAGNGYEMDIHELSLTDRGTALFPIYKLVQVQDPSKPKGQLMTLMDGIVQEVDIQTGLVVWEWHCLGAIPLKDSYATASNSAYYDAYHINSIQDVRGGKVLVSLRNTSALYLIDREGSEIDWTLGGKASDFKLGKGARFWFQHDAQLHGTDRVTMFDDQAGPPQKAPRSRGLMLKLDHRKKTATVALELNRPGNTSAQSEGSMQKLPNGNWAVGWGAEPWMSEFTAKGKLLFDAAQPVDNGSYRVYRFPWKATPRTKPKLAVSRAGAGAVVSASWNGATDVASWEVVAVTGPTSTTRVATAKRTDFETQIPVPGDASRTFAVRALDAKGKVLATSDTATAPPAAR